MEFTFTLEDDMGQEALDLAMRSGYKDVGGMASKLIVREIAQAAYRDSIAKLKVAKAAEIAKRYGLEVAIDDGRTRIPE
jgi:hypothetical protein